MNPEFQNKLTKTFPWFNSYAELNGDGWNNLIWNLCREIDDAYFDEGKECKIMMLQCKEKFGELNFYYGYLNDDSELNENVIGNIIDKYVELSKSTCEICGEEGHMLMDGYWMKTRCWGCMR